MVRSVSHKSAPYTWLESRPLFYVLKDLRIPALLPIQAAT